MEAVAEDSVADAEAVIVEVSAVDVVAETEADSEVVVEDLAAVTEEDSVVAVEAETEEDSGAVDPQEEDLEAVDHQEVVVDLQEVDAEEPEE